MLDLLSTTLLTLNPRADVLEYLTLEHNPIEAVSELDDFDMKDCYILNSLRTKNDLLIEELGVYFENIDEDLNIGNEVYVNSSRVLDCLYPSLSQELEFNNLYPTNYGTVVMDWEKESGDVFSLEVGAKSLGYFIEKNGRDIKQVDDMNFHDNTLEEVFNDLETFLRD